MAATCAGVKKAMREMESNANVRRCKLAIAIVLLSLSLGVLAVHHTIIIAGVVIGVAFLIALVLLLVMLAYINRCGNKIPIKH